MNIRVFVQNFDRNHYVLVNDRLMYHVSAKPFTFLRELYIKDAETEKVLVTIKRARGVFSTSYVLTFEDGSVGEFTTHRWGIEYRLNYSNNVFTVTGSINPFKYSFIIRRNDKQVGSSNKISNRLFSNEFYNYIVDDNVELLPTVALVVIYNDLTRKR